MIFQDDPQVVVQRSCYHVLLTHRVMSSGQTRGKLNQIGSKLLRETKLLYGSMWRSLLALASWKSARKAKDCFSFRERISMSRRQRLVFLESVPSFVRCFSCALGPPNTGCHRKQTNIHLFHSFSWHLVKKEQRNSKRDDDGASRWVAAWASTVVSCYSDIQTGKRQNI